MNCQRLEELNQWVVTYQTCRAAFVIWFFECMVNVTVIYMCVFNCENLKNCMFHEAQ